MSIKDSTGDIAYADAVTIQSSSQTEYVHSISCFPLFTTIIHSCSCLNGGGSSASPAVLGNSSPSPAAVSGTTSSAAPSSASAP